LTSGILGHLNASDPMKVPAEQFNQAAEDYYRETLQKEHLIEALEYLERDLQGLDEAACLGDKNLVKSLKYNVNGQSCCSFLKRIKRDLLADQLDIETLQSLINLLILTVSRDTVQADWALKNTRDDHESYTPVHRAQ
jgi:hypothetical protein